MASSYTTYIGWVAKTNQDWLKFASGNTEGEKAGFVTLSKNRRILTVSDEGGSNVENFTILYDAAANFSVNERTATVTLTQNYNSTSGAIKTVKITQTGAKITGATFTVKEGNIINPSEDGIKYDIQYTIGTPKEHYADEWDTHEDDDFPDDEPAPGADISDDTQPYDDDLLTAYDEVNGHSLDNTDSLDDASTIETTDPSVLSSDETSDQNTSPWIEAGSAVLPSDETNGQHSSDTWITGHPSADDEVVWGDPGDAEIDDGIVNPNHDMAENDDTDVEMNRKYKFDSGNTITPDAGVVRTKLTCEVNFIVEVTFSYSASTTNKGLYWYCGEHEYVSKDQSFQPIWYKAAYDERTSKYEKGDKLSYDNDDENAILNAINSSIISGGNIYMSAATSQTVSSIISGCSWHKDDTQKYVTLTTSDTYGYYEYSPNNYIDPQTQDLAERPITIIRERESVSGSSSSWVLTQPRNSFRDGYDAEAWIGNGLPIPPRPYHVSYCSGSTNINYVVTRRLEYPDNPIESITETGVEPFKYETNLSVIPKRYDKQTIRVSVLGLTDLHLTTINYIIQSGIPENNIEMTSSSYEYDITSITYNGISYDVGECIPSFSGNITVNVNVEGNYTYKVNNTCGYDITFSCSSLTPVTITQEVSKNPNTSSRNINVTISGTAIINVITGLVDRQDFYKVIQICQEGSLNYILKSNPENAEFNVGRIPLIDSDWTTRRCELTITSEE